MQWHELCKAFLVEAQWQQRGPGAPSSIACCMAEPWCAGEEQARAAVQGVIAKTWKLLNWEVVVAASGPVVTTPPSAHHLRWKRKA